jgi:hypothetical protein
VSFDFAGNKLEKTLTLAESGAVVAEQKAKVS